MSTTQIIPTYVYTEMTPNPASLKFVADRVVIPDGAIAEFENAEGANASELAQRLFAFPFVKGVFVMSNFVTVTKVGDADWDFIKNELREFIQRFLMENQWAATAGTISEDISKEGVVEEIGHNVESELDAKIAGILDEYVRPAVERDGGAIHFKSFKEGKVTVSLRGSCSGCPSATVTLKSGIETLLKSMLPEVHEVVAEEN